MSAESIEDVARRIITHHRPALEMLAHSDECESERADFRRIADGRWLCTCGFLVARDAPAQSEGGEKMSAQGSGEQERGE